LDNPLAEDVVLLYSGTDVFYYQLELSAPNSWINPFHEKLFEYSGCSSSNWLLAAFDPFLDPERLISGLFYDPDDFVFVEIVHGTTLLLPTSRKSKNHIYVLRGRIHVK
jgi:hypothetical protein